jgi:hypothetical protein
VSIAEQDGVLDQVTDKGIILGGNRLSYSKWFEGDRPTEDDLGCRMQVVVDVGTKCSFLKKVLQIGEKADGWKPPELSNRGFGGGGGGRRSSPEELELEREKGIRIARSVAIDRAITMAKEGIPIGKVASLAQAIEEYVLKGTFPPVTTSSQKEAPGKSAPEKPPSASSVKSAPDESPPEASAKKNESPTEPSKLKRLENRAVNLLFNEAKKGGLVLDWNDYLVYIQNVLKVDLKSPYHLSVEDFTKVATVLRSKLGRQAAA